MKKRRKRKIKWTKVLFITIIPIIIIGGIIMYYNHNLKNDESSKSKKENTQNEITNNQEEIKKEENTDKANNNLEKTPNNNSEYQNLNDGDYLTSTGYTLTIKDGIAYIDGHLIVNKTYSIPSSYKPINPETTITGERCNNCLEKEVMESFRLMQSDATSVGLNIYIASGYRSYSYQERLYNNYTAVSGVAGADTYSARPGHSEHQTGLCFDLNSVDDSFAYTDEGKWINENAYLYGFIIRYPKGKENITGYQYESWHLRYVGKDLASKLYNNGNWITMEEYYGISSSY